MEGVDIHIVCSEYKSKCHLVVERSREGFCLNSSVGSDKRPTDLSC